MCARACVAEFAVTAMSRPVPPARSPLLGHSVAFISRSVFFSVSVFPRKNTISINRRTIYRKVFGEHVQPCQWVCVTCAAWTPDICALTIVVIFI